MKRAELAKLTGYSEEHLSRIAPTIPGAFLRGKQYEYDETHPNFQKWLTRTLLKLGTKSLRMQRLIRAKRRTQRSRPEIIKAMNNVVTTFEKCRPVLPKIRISKLGVQFREPPSFEEWRQSFEFMFAWSRGLSPEELATVSARLAEWDVEQLFFDYLNALMQFNNLSGGEPLPVEETHATPGASLIRPKKRKSISSSEIQST
jgi:hypothetical protein